MNTFIEQSVNKWSHSLLFTSWNCDDCDQTAANEFNVGRRELLHGIPAGSAFCKSFHRLEHFRASPRTAKRAPRRLWWSQTICQRCLAPTSAHAGGARGPGEYSRSSLSKG